jgi:hypothetical protein
LNPSWRAPIQACLMTSSSWFCSVRNERRWSALSVPDRPDSKLREEGERKIHTSLPSFQTSQISFLPLATSSGSYADRGEMRKSDLTLLAWKVARWMAIEEPKETPTKWQAGSLSRSCEMRQSSKENQSRVLVRKWSDSRRNWPSA